MKSLKLPFALLAVFAGLAFAQAQPPGQEPSPLATQTAQTSQRTPVTPDAIDILLSAKTVAAVGDVGWREDLWLWGGPSPDKSQKRLQQELRKWGRFQVVSDVAEADLIVLLIEGTRQKGLLGGLGPRSARAYAQLIVFRGGQLPKKFEKPLWQADEDAGMLSTSATGKVITRFRKHLEQLTLSNAGRQLLANQPSSRKAAPTSAAAAVTQATAPAATPAETTTPGSPSGQPQPAIAQGASPRTEPETTGRPLAFDPLERMRNAKTVAIMVTAPRAKTSFWEKMQGVAASEEQAGGIVQQELSAWNHFTLVDDPRRADLVFAAYEWNEPFGVSILVKMDMIEVYEGGAALDRDDPPLWTSGAWTRSMKEQVRDVRNEIERDPKQIQPVSNPNAKNLKNPDWQHKSKLDEKIGDARRLLRKNWADPGLHNRVGVILTWMGHLNSAGYEFRQALLLKPDYHNAHANLADVLAKLGDINGAIVHSWQAVRLEAANTEDQRLLSALLERKGHRIGSAPETHEPNLETKDWEYHAILAHALLETGNLDDALSEYRKAVERSPVAPHPHDDLGCALLIKGEHDAAIAEFQQATRIEPGYAWGHFNLGRALQAKGDVSGALVAFNQAYTLEPNNPEFKAKLEAMK